jgi:hypothetical protein
MPITVLAQELAALSADQIEEIIVTAKSGSSRPRQRDRKARCSGKTRPAAQ